jgi:hypothetical protein
MNHNIFDIRILLILYLTQLSSLTNNTLGKQLKEFVYSNRLIQHIINLVFLFVLISMLDQGMNINSVLISGVAIYLIYILTTKLDLQFNLIILSLMVIYYFYKREMDKKDNRLISDKDLDILIKNNIINIDENKYNLMGLGILGILIYCVYIYMNRKSVQYGGGFSYSKFLIY